MSNGAVYNKQMDELTERFRQAHGRRQTAEWKELEALKMMGQCEFCGAQSVQLVARLKADPDQLVCQICVEDPRIPTEAIPIAAGGRQC